jgi:hypothetical protein
MEEDSESTSQVVPQLVVLLREVVLPKEEEMKVVNQTLFLLEILVSELKNTLLETSLDLAVVSKL